MTPIGNVAAAVIALLGWCALGLQCYLTVSTRMAEGSSLIAGVVFSFSFFTVTTNTLVAVMLTAPLVRPRLAVSSASTPGAPALPEHLTGKAFQRH